MRQRVTASWHVLVCSSSYTNSNAYLAMEVLENGLNFTPDGGHVAEALDARTNV